MHIFAKYDVCIYVFINILDKTMKIRSYTSSSQRKQIQLDYWNHS